MGAREVAGEFFEARERSRGTSLRRAGGRGGPLRGAWEVAEDCFEARGRSRRTVSRRVGGRRGPGSSRRAGGRSDRSEVGKLSLS